MTNTSLVNFLKTWCKATWVQTANSTAHLHSTSPTRDVQQVQTAPIRTSCMLLTWKSFWQSQALCSLECPHNPRYTRAWPCMGPGNAQQVSSICLNETGGSSDVTVIEMEELGVKQGCDLATLFIVPFEFLLVVIQLDLKDVGISFTTILTKMISPTSN